MILMQLLAMKPLLEKDSTYCLKGLCMLMIILHHSFTHGAPMHDRLVFCSHIYWWGFIGTGLFFFLSGYGLYCSLNGKESLDWNWLSKKLKKLLIPYVVMYLTYATVLVVSGIVQLDWQIAKNMLTISLPNNSGALWFMKVITGIYIVVFLVWHYFPNSLRYRLIIISSVVIAYFLVTWFGGMNDYWWSSVLCFPVGLYAGYALQNYPPHSVRFGYKTVTAFSITLLSLVVFQHKHSTDLGIVFVAITASLVLCLFLQYVRIENGFFRFIGNNSMDFYVFQMPLLYFSKHYFGNHWSIWFFIPLGTLIITFVYEKISTYRFPVRTS